MADQEFWDDQFTKVAGTPISWQLSARDLIATANLPRRLIVQHHLEQLAELHTAKQAGQPPRMGKFPPVAPTLMLYSFAIENLAKAVMIAKGTPSSRELTLAKELSNHRLLELVRRAGLTLKANDIKLLEKMERSVERGRYPVPKKPHQRPYADGIRIPTDFDSVLSLLQRLEDLLRHNTVHALPAEQLANL